MDAIDDNNDIVEITASNPQYWGTRVIFPMISSGSTVLFHGQKRKDILTQVLTKSLSRVSD